MACAVFCITMALEFIILIKCSLNGTLEVTQSVVGSYFW